MSEETKALLSEKRKAAVDRRKLVTIYRAMAASYVNGLRDMAKR
jgi:hypothetical protein